MMLREAMSRRRKQEYVCQGFMSEPPPPWLVLVVVVVVVVRNQLHIFCGMSLLLSRPFSVLSCCVPRGHEPARGKDGWIISRGLAR